MRRANRAGGGVAVDLGLYLLSAGFAWLTASSNLPAHRPWGAIAAIGYAVAALAALVQLVTRNRGGRGAVVLGTWGAVCLLPLVFEAVQRADGRLDRAQEEVLVVENSGIRMLETGSPFLSRADIAAIPEPLLGYTPYQPAMAVFGLPRAVLGAHWYTDARVYFALVTALCLFLALRTATTSPPRLSKAGLLSPASGTTPASTGDEANGAGSPDVRTAGTSGRVRALQAVTVLPVAALTLATGGDDLPVLALTLLGLAYLARGKDTATGVVLGLAAALKLFAWPVAAVVLIARLLTRRSTGAGIGKLAVPMIAIPVLTALPALVVNPGAFVENVLKFPLGHGLVKSPAASPLPGHLITENVPGGRYIALGLLGLAACALGWWLLRRPPRTAAAAAAVCATGLLTAMLLMPATRFGYLLYPAAYALWIPFLGSLGPVREPDPA
ncbi:glycosyltransferase 87 family protein [Longispora sp. NPDC051575]|uniref:glycosyltransferase 87 family protein n=1 Tax=Longispora sp. NPDC051575 TaxID=3154943 RepID=UPI00344A56B6